ncbi:tetraacyldisaccharide 4'-kinase [Candidatus Pelagibacter communis]|uniref:tetraacyldisaccharide 4'-kinase n=1 Tax=Pelagibacter ubique TaxID=198252 RepID=UPI00094DBB1F|nr:tetraacyldisaccharide 4'-kinase [Candidatus Pelagibacter ubique]
MKFYKPKFWDKKGYPNLISMLLYPLSLIVIIKNYYENSKMKKNYYDFRTICVGNIYIGGTGKTPLVNNLASHFKKRFKTIIIKKNYTSQIDEKKLLETEHKVIFEKTRELSLLKAEHEKAQVVIFDDGLQEKTINYDLKIVCFNSLKLDGNGLVIPAGPLRERLNSIKHYDVVFINGNFNKQSKDFIDRVKSINPNIKVFRGKYVPKNHSKLKKKRFLIFSGIGNPHTFSDTLKSMKIKFYGYEKYPDHYNYKESDLQKLKDLARIKGCELLTTEKDYLRIKKNFRKNINFLKIELLIDQEKQFYKYLNDKL